MEPLSKAWNILGDKFMTWFETGVAMVPNIGVAVLILMAFVLVAKVSRRLTENILAKSSDNKAVNGLLSTVTYVTILAVGTFTALGVLNLDKTVTSLLAGAGVIGLALGFAFQDIAANFVSGILIAFRRPFKVGDIVQLDGYLGSIKEINLRTTLIVTFDGLEVIMPNKNMFTQAVTNYTSTPERRIDLEVGVSYGDDLKKVEKVALEALEDLEERISDRPPEFFYTEFGGSSINFQARFWVEYPGHQSFLKGRHNAIMAIKEAFDANNISIPYPIRTLDFGIKGGENLRSPLHEVFSENSDSSNQSYSM